VSYFFCTFGLCLINDRVQWIDGRGAAAWHAQILSILRTVAGALQLLGKIRAMHHLISTERISGYLATPIAPASRQSNRSRSRSRQQLDLDSVA
jgi:hypothetical protein